MNSLQDLINSGYGGYQGWGETEALADYGATGGVGKFTSGSGSSGGGGGGSSAPDISGVPSVQDFLSGQFGQENLSLQALIEKMLGQENPLDIYSRLESEAGLPTLRATSQSLSKEIANIEDTLDMIEPDVAATTRESLMTESQRRGLVSSKKDPFLQKLTKLGTAAGRVGEQISTAMQGVGTKTELAMAGQEQELEPYKLQYTTLIDRNARALTGFTEDRKTQLDQIYAKWERDNYLDDREWELAQELAGEERNYLRTLQTAAAEAGYSVTGGESAEQLLSILGTKASESIAFDRSQKSKTGSTAAQKTEALQNLASDAAQGISLSDAQTKYAGKLSTEEIVEGYTASTWRGTPVEDWAREMLGLSAEGEDKADVQYWLDRGYNQQDAAYYASLNS